MSDLEIELIPAARQGLPVLVFLHEGLGSVSMWKDFPAEIAARTRCGALVYSRYGNGESRVLQEARPVSYMHDEALQVLPRLLEAHDIHDAVLFGHSDGASIAQINAGEIGKRVRAIIAEAPHVFVEDISVRSIAAVKVAFENGGLKPKLARYHHDVDRTFYGWNDIWLDPDFRDWNILQSVEKIAAPMLLIQGEQDEYGTLAQIDAIRRHARKSAIDSLVLANCGHSPHRDRRGAVAAAVSAFFPVSGGR